MTARGRTYIRFSAFAKLRSKRTSLRYSFDRSIQNNTALCADGTRVLPRCFRCRCCENKNRPAAGVNSPRRRAPVTPCGTENCALCAHRVCCCASVLRKQEQSSSRSELPAPPGVGYPLRHIELCIVYKRAVCYRYQCCDTTTGSS